MLPYIILFGHYIQSYYLCAALAGAAGIGLAIITLRREHLGIWRFLLPVLIAAFSLLGARILNYLLNPAAYGASFPIWSLSYRNLSIMGGLMTGTVVLLFFALSMKRSCWPLLDEMVLPGGVAIVLLKTGCFLNGCCYGRSTSSFWGVEFPANKMFYDYLDTLKLITPQPRTVYPTQLYEMLGAALGVFVVWILMNRKLLRPGVGALLFAIWFTMIRLLIHPLRSFPYERVITHAIYPIFYCAILVLLIALLVSRLDFKNKKR